MAAIRIVDYWLRSPAFRPSHYRSVMVVSERWAEQRVLMRAYSDSRDQTLPTIVLHAQELAIGPAGTDINGPWGIHVGAPGEVPEGRAQEIKWQLEEAARRLAGSKGNAPRLQDEESTFEREPTANWGPGSPRVLPARRSEPLHAQPAVAKVTPVGAARVPVHQRATMVEAQPVRAHRRTRQHTGVNGLSTAGVANGSRTALGYTSGSGAQSAVVRLGLTPQLSARLGRLVDRVVPQEFTIDARERRVLNALGDGELSARQIGDMLDVADAVTYMEELVRKLENYNLDLIEPGRPSGGEPTYRLRSTG